MMTVTPARKSKSQGQALVEFGLILPVLLLIITGIIDFGQVTITYIQSLSALRNAARFAEVAGFTSVPGAPVRYLDCDGMIDAANDILFANNQTINITYHKANDYGNTTYNCDTVSADVLRNGDILEIVSSARVQFITPLVNGIVPDLNIEFAARRTIVKSVLLGSPNDELDTDYDGLADQWELDWFGNLAAIATGDPDGDGCNNGCEEARTTCPVQVGAATTCPGVHSKDSDNDGLDDADEAYIHDTLGDDDDTDNDGLNDYDEVVIEKTDPNVADSDGDGLSDGEEVSGVYSNGIRTDPKDTDSDDDGISDFDEVRTHNTNPHSVDSDNDTLTDFAELMTHQTNPNSTDTDIDRLGDADEVAGLYNTSAIKHDTDGDQLWDGDEVLTYETRADYWDTDGDGLSDYEEILLATDPKDMDSDDDNIPDGEEAALGADPLNDDTDGDGVKDGDEIACGTLPTTISTFPPALDAELCNGGGSVDPDTDKDGLPDIWETNTFGHLGFGPLDDPDNDGLFNQDERLFGTHGNMADTDGDGRTDKQEVHGIGGVTSNPKLYDTDGDGLSDGEEVNVFGTNPNLADTDSDGLSDSVELITFGTKPTIWDSDGDGLSDGQEYQLNTNANNVDTDKDGLWDGEEVNFYQTNPLDADHDDDGLLDGEEIKLSIDPKKPDTDDDRLTDWQEVKLYMTAPNDNDHDNDGLLDGEEVLNFEGHPDMALLRTDPKKPDTDGDGRTDSQEIKVDFTFPNNKIAITVLTATFQQSNKKDEILTGKFTVTLDKVSREDTHFTVTSLQGSDRDSATMDLDFERITNKPYVIPAGKLTTEVEVKIYPRDKGNEGSETFIIELHNNKNGYFAKDKDGKKIGDRALMTITR